MRSGLRAAPNGEWIRLRVAPTNSAKINVNSHTDACSATMTMAVIVFMFSRCFARLRLRARFGFIGGLRFARRSFGRLRF
jgi:hypothetical protein